MKGFLRLLLMMFIAFGLVRCVTAPSDGDSETPAIEEDFDHVSQASPSADSAGGELSIEDELNQAEGAPKVNEEAPVASSEGQSSVATNENKNEPDSFADFENQSKPQTAPQEEAIPPQVDTAIEPPPPEIAPQDVPPPVIAEPTPPVEAGPATSQVAHIKNIRYKANDNGGTIVIEADGPLTYETRNNPDTNQFVIEIANSDLPDKLKRPFNTRDMKGGIGSIDAYQNKGSTTTRVVVQLRAGVPEPTIQQEGNSLLVVQSGSPVNSLSQKSSEASPESPSAMTATSEAASTESSSAPAVSEENLKTNLLSANSLEEFLSGNTQFYGKKISVEVSQMDVREVFKLISEESGINLVLSDEVKGTITLKLRQVPWDQALVVIMKARKLGYTRAGNVLRVAPLTDIKTEEDDSLKMASARKAQMPLKVRMIPISYAKIDDLATQVKSFLSERGKVVGDVRTSSIVISDLDENLERVAKLIKSIDVPPPQVLIEGKIVEATEQFQRQVGINWSATGQQGLIGYGVNHKPIRGLVSTAISPSMGASAAHLNFQLGTLDVLGDLNATLALFEQQNSVRVLSSPRIVTLHNEAAEINQTQEVPLIKENVGSTGIISKSVEFKPVKLKLSVTPQITNDASVIMSVDVSREFLTGVVDQATQANPIASRSAKTKVMVKNSQTAVIGGIYQSDQTNGESRVPWVAEIPIFGWLFKSRSNTNNKNELLIFLTPRILGQADSQSIPSQGTGGGTQ